MIEYTIDTNARLIKIQMRGNNSCADLEEYCAQLYRDPQYDVTFDSLFQIDGEAGGPILAELSKVKQVLELVAQTTPAMKKWAVVVPSGFKRLLAEYFFKDACLKPVEMRFFGSEIEARSWLNSAVKSRTCPVAAEPHP
jgi:SpoIIAA-like